MKKEMAAINIMVDKKTKDKATEILDELGLSMSMTINIYLKQIIRRKGIPFNLKTDKKANK